MSGLYVHIPFCASRCIYCGFFSTTLSSLKDRYVDALCHEMDIRRGEIRDTLSTVYLGGGTPSQLSVAQIDRLTHYIYNMWEREADLEFTIECNPDDVTPAFAGAISMLPVNRVSMGAQTFDDERLRFLRRRHTSAQVFSAVEALRKAGIGNISIDLMFGFPGQTNDVWAQDVAKALSLGVEHVSAYSLMYEEGTPLYGLLREGRVSEIGEEDSLKMYDTLCDGLVAADYEHYEISNFARPGFRSRHNSSYWSGAEYVGIGAAAHSYDVLTRSWNVADVRRYIEMVERGVRPLDGKEDIDDDTRYDEAVTTALRTSEGLRLSALKPKYRQYIMKEGRRYLDSGLLEMNDGCLRLTRRGIYVSDGIMADLMYV